MKNLYNMNLQNNESGENKENKENKENNFSDINKMIAGEPDIDKKLKTENPLDSKTKKKPRYGPGSDYAKNGGGPSYDENGEEICISCGSWKSFMLINSNIYSVIL